MLKVFKLAGIVALLSSPVSLHAQGFFGGAERGAAEGGAAAGPVGSVVGGAVGGAVGTVNGALGIHPRYYHRHWAHEHRSGYHHRRHWHHHHHYY